MIAENIQNTSETSLIFTPDLYSHRRGTGNRFSETLRSQVSDHKRSRVDELSDRRPTRVLFDMQIGL